MHKIKRTQIRKICQMRTDRQKYMQQKGIVQYASCIEHRASSSDTDAIHIPTAQNGHSIDELHL